MKKSVLLSLFTGVVMLQGCHQVKNNDAPSPPQVQSVGMANPADVYCSKIGGKLNAKQNAQGEYSTCTLPSGEEIESWQLFHRDHPINK